MITTNNRAPGDRYRLFSGLVAAESFIDRLFRITARFYIPTPLVLERRLSLNPCPGEGDVFARQA
ncbi:hypothetical protein ACFRFL_45405 [Streptomyces sp. NPDC056708]|uniref:hypothetical protein n=1 Tax=unclassified Streptomyces TaxID=2593676 RepID=UPI0036B4F477